MTNELEKQFFDTFGVEPHKVYPPQDELFGTREEMTEFFEEAYPQITDHILLELICLCPDLDDVFFTDVERLKETLLKSYINIYNYYINVELLSDCGKELKQQVHTLFEDNNDR